jgi:hypothetical protein
MGALTRLEGSVVVAYVRMVKTASRATAVQITKRAYRRALQPISSVMRKLSMTTDRYFHRTAWSERY